MFRKKSIYFLSILLIFALVLTGCGGGSDSTPGTDDENDDETPTAETVSISGQFNFPDELSSAGVSSLNNDDEYEIVVENFDSGKMIEDIDITFTGEEKYKVSGIETGQDIVINIVRSNDKLKISTFIPEVTKEDENEETVGNADSATTILTAVIKKQKEKSGNIKLTRDQVKDRKKEVENISKDINSDHLRGIVEDVENDRIEQSDEITETITKVKEKIEDGQSKENAEKMVDFVRNSGLLIEESANTHETIIKKNLDTLGTGMDNFTTEFETEMRSLFTQDFISKLPTNVTDEEYNLSDLDETEAEFTEELFEENEWRWEINSGENSVIITTNFPAMIDTVNNPDKVDISDAEFKYQINDSESDKYFEGTFEIISEEIREIPVLDVDGEKLFDMTAPVDGDMIINGNYRTISMDNEARLNITLSEDTDLDDASGTGKQHVELYGYIDIPNIFEFDGQITYDAAAKYDSDYVIQELDYIDVKADGLFTTQAPEQNNIIINAENIDFEILGPDEELQYIFLRGSISDEEELVKWSGEIDVNFDTYTDNYGYSELLVKEFNFMGSVNKKENEELVLNVNPIFNYDEDGNLVSGESTIRLEQGNVYLAGKITADSNRNKVVLENENHSKFYLEESDDEGIIEENSYIANATGEKIADIDSEGRIYYMDDENGGTIGSLY